MDFLSLLLLVFSLIFTVVSRLLHLYSTIDKTKLFIKDEKFLHSEAYTERFTELHGEDIWTTVSFKSHTSTLAWKSPWTEEPGRLQSMGPLRVGHN